MRRGSHGKAGLEAAERKSAVAYRYHGRGDLERGYDRVISRRFPGPRAPDKPAQGKRGTSAALGFHAETDPAPTGRHTGWARRW